MLIFIKLRDLYCFQKVKGRYAKGYLLQSINLRKQKFGNNDTNLSFSYNKIGNYYFYFGRYDSAQIFYQKALDLSLLKKNLNNPETASYFQNLGIIYSLKGDYEEAEDLFLISEISDKSSTS